MCCHLYDDSVDDCAGVDNFGIDMVLVLLVLSLLMVMMLLLELLE
jgi:competence protein ComGC